MATPMRTAPALVALILLSLCAMPSGKDAAAGSAQTKAIQGAAESSDGAASKADYALKDTGTTAPPTKNALHRTAEAGGKTADVRTDARQLRESEHWVNYYARAYRVPVPLLLDEAVRSELRREDLEHACDMRVSFSQFRNSWEDGA
jgi:hypothetical protein